MVALLLLLLGSSSILCLSSSSRQEPTEEEAANFLASLDKEFCLYGNLEMAARWGYITNITQHNEEAMNDARLAFQKVKKEASKNVTEFDWPSYSQPDLGRQAKFYRSLGSNITDEMLMQMNELQTSMESAYSTAKICPYTDHGEGCTPTWELEPDLVEVLSSSRDYSELSYVWSEWRRVSGDTYRQTYLDFIQLNQEAAKSLGFNNLQEQWLERYESEDFSTLVSDVWRNTVDVEGEQRSLEQFYKQLHAYVRTKLMATYNPQGANIKANGPIPANLLGNMWAQTWDNIEDIVKPFNDTKILDVTDEMVSQNYTVDQMYRLSEEFFMTLGFEKMTEIFWEKSMLTKPEDRDVVCHASAEDFFEDSDFRIKMCTMISHADLVTVHHEMGHIVYFMQYSDQPFVYREAANPGFHEAIGDTMALAVNTPGHLQGLGLMPSRQETVRVQDNDVPKEDIAYLFHVALQKLAFLPFSYVMDSWRWGLFTEDIKPENMNSEWWRLREELQGVSSPAPITEDQFHAGSKYHIPANVPYIRYFVSYIVQFQFYEALCAKSGQYVEGDPGLPLYLCDFSLGGEETGHLIREVMEGGFEKPWQEALQDMTGSPEMTAASFLKYFSPLYDFLEEENKKAGACIGWGADCEEKARTYIEKYGEEMLGLLETQVQADWEYYTSISQETQEAAGEQARIVAAFEKASWEDELTQYQPETFTDPVLARRFQLHARLGHAALPAEDFAAFNSLVANLTSIYGAAKICPFDKPACDLESEGMTLEPGIEAILADTENRSWEELVYVWEAWRNATGREMRSAVPLYKELSNQAARANGLSDMGELWLDRYTSDMEEGDDFRGQLEDIWQQLKPLYEKIHAYVRYRYSQHWGEEHMPDPRAAIPAHLMGNMWAQAWQGTFNIVSPFPQESSPFDEVDANLLAQNYTERMIFELSDDFYSSLGLADMEMCYDTPCGTEDTEQNRDCVHQNPMIVKPDWDVVCHASAWDMYKSGNDDFRIKMCTEVNLEDLVTIHHEMGHIQYDLQYKDKPIEFRDGANPGFHEAIGDTMALAVNTPGHLKQVGLLTNTSETMEADINFLLAMAMERLVFLPFAYTIDQFRWGLFNGSIPVEEMNSAWWRLREKYQGIAPPVPRSEADFDAGAKYHVAADVSYIRYFVAHILEYQFYRQMCTVSGNYDPLDETKPLHKCDFSQGEKALEAGKILQTMLSSGSSRPWPDVLEDMTGGRQMDASAILDYFAPLTRWLDEEIADSGIMVGWDPINSSSTTSPTSSSTTLGLSLGLGLCMWVVFYILFI